MTWVMDVEYATLKLGAIDGTSRVVVLADSYADAVQVAAGMVCCRYPDVMPTAVLVIL